MNGLIDLKITSMNFPLEILAATIFAIAVSTYMILDLVDYIKSKITMAHSSPEGIKLSKGSRLVSAQLSINGKSVASTEKRSKKYSTEEVVSLLESLIEHPSKPGYKRHDIISKIHEIKNGETKNASSLDSQEKLLKRVYKSGLITGYTLTPSELDNIDSLADSWFEYFKQADKDLKF
jgi:hypothetical protein